MKFYNVIIIGGGASGLCTAIKAKKENNTVLVIEHGNRVGKKILSTGNGKCNLTNVNCKVELFGKNPEGIYPFFSDGKRSFVEKVISKFDAADAVEFFKGLGMFPEIKNGYVYPRSEQAASILDLLRFKCKEIGVDIVTECNVSSAKENDEQSYGNFSVMLETENPETEIKGCKKSEKLVKNVKKYCMKLFCDKLVIATGGMAAPKTGSDGSGYALAKSFGHSIIKPIPALCGIKCSDKFFKELAGVRCDGTVSLIDENKSTVTKANGNLQFNDYGISGIPVFQISSVCGRMLEQGKKAEIKIDFLPEASEEEMIEFLEGKNEDTALLGVLNKKVASVAAKEANSTKSRHVGESFAVRIVPIIKRFKVHPTELCSFEQAQVTSGGVSTDEINPETMESLLTKNLFFTGEIIDVNGICGGYNLQWAWSSAHVAAMEIQK